MRNEKSGEVEALQAGAEGAKPKNLKRPKNLTRSLFVGNLPGV